MTPQEFNQFRDHLNPASGFQSVQFRELEFACGLRRTEVLQWIELDDAQRARLERRRDRTSLYDRVKALLRRRGFATDSSDELIESYRQIYTNEAAALRLVPLARRAHRVRRALSAVARPPHSNGRANDRPKARHGRLLGRTVSRRHAGLPLLPRALGGSHVSRAREATHERNCDRQLADAHMPRAVSNPRKLNLSRQPFDGRGAAGRAQRARRLIGTSGPPTDPRRGSAGCRGSPRSPTASARSSGRRAGSVFLGPNVSVLQAAIATCIDFRARAQRSRLRGAAVSVADVRVARMGTLRSGRARRYVRRRPHDSHRAHRRRDHGKDGDRRASRTRITSPARSPTSGRFKRIAARSARCSASTPIKRRASIRTTSLHWISISSRADRTNGSAADRDAAGSTSSRRCSETLSSGDYGMDGARAPVRVRSRSRSSTPPRCTVSATARPRFRVTSSPLRDTK